MFRVLLTLLLLATGPGQAARGAVPGSPFGPAPPQNQAPETVDYIDVGTLYVGGSSATVNASSYFSDPNDDTLTYSVNNPSPTVATVSISGSTVTIAPVAVGTTGKIVVTAEDPGGLTATQDFNVTVENAPPPNRAPTAVGSISNVTLRVGGSSATRSVSGKFSDPDGDALTYSVNDPDTSIATVSISGSTVTIAPVAVGTTGKIVVTAKDPGGLTATQDFTATVENPPPVNRAPTAVGSISNVTLQVGGSSATRSVSGKFSDPDGDTLTYSVNNPNPSIAGVSISGSTVTIAPVAGGTTGKIIVTARDPGGLTATQDFAATVENPPPVNRAPTAVGSISNMTLQVGGSSGTRSVSGKFSDPDNDTLTYTVNSPNPLIAAVSISGSTVTVAPVAAGSTGKIIVTARDPGGLTATQDFIATVENPPPPPPPVVNRVTVTPATPSIHEGETQQFSATAYDSNNMVITGKTFTWTSGDTSVATVSASGLATGKDTGSTTIKASVDRVSGTATLTVTEPPPPPPPPPPVVHRVTVTPATPSIAVGETQQFTATAYDSSGTEITGKTFTWTSSDTSVATISTSGLATGKTAGVTAITAEVDDTSNAVRLTVTKPPPPPPPPPVVHRVTVTPATPSIAVGETQQFTATAYDSSGTEITGKTFTWTSSDTSVATISTSGLATGKTAGVTAITAEVDDTSNAVRLTVTKPPPPPPPPPVVHRVTVTPATPSIAVGETQQFTATAYDSSGTEISGKTFTWTSSDTSVATISTSGLATGKTAGVTAITAEVDDTSNAVRLTVTKPPPPPPPPPVVHRVTVTPATPSIAVGETQQFTATAYDSSGTEISGKTFTWTSSDTSVATISTSGLATGKTAGVTAITAEVDDTSNAVRLTVTKPPPPPPPPPVVHRVTVTPATPSIAVGETQQFTATAYDSSGTEISGKTFTWTSNDTTVANINSSGLATAVNAGSTTITATTDGVSGTASLTVTEPPTCPMLKGSIADQMLTLGGSAAPIDLTQYFSLPVDFVPTYVVSSTDTSVTTTSLAGAMLTVTPSAAGTDTVSVTVSKQDCDSVKQSFVVTVNLPCPSAIADAPIPDQTLVVGAGTTEIDLTQHFEHIDQEGIEITVTSPSPGIATAAIKGTSLKIDPVAAGQIAAVTVTISDTAESDPCDAVSLSFMVTVEAAVEHPGLYPWSVSGEQVYRLTGNVGIGVEVPDQKLVVDGTVKAEGYRLRMIPADYVFEAGYDLLSLDEVASYIRKHGHLPGVDSGAEMKANGLGISRMQTTLLEKIEELSLYIIAQHEQLSVQGDRLASQQQKLEARETQASELEQRLRRLER